MHFHSKHPAVRTPTAPLTIELRLAATCWPGCQAVKIVDTGRGVLLGKLTLPTAWIDHRFLNEIQSLIERKAPGIRPDIKLLP